MDILVTRRLTLRPPLAVDAESIAQAFQNPRITANLANVPAPYALTDAEEWIEKTRLAEQPLNFCIYREKLLGSVGVSHMAERDEYNLGYWLDEPFWGNGFMSEAARAVLSYAFRNLDTGVIASRAYEDNARSLAVLEKLGFEGTQTVETHNNPTRGSEVTCLRYKLTRDRFERLFGALESPQAA